MKVTKQELDNCEVLLTVELEDKQKNRVLEKAARRLSRKYRIPGFRPGKAPYRIVANKLGLEVIQDEAMSELTENIFQQALKEADVTPYAQASLDEIEWEPLKMQIKIPTEPIVELGDYRNLRIDFEPPEVSDEEIQARLEQLLEQHTAYTPVERTAELGDRVQATITETDTETGEELAEAKNYTVTIELAEEDDPAPDISTNVIGLAAGGEISWTHTYPDDYHDEKFAGKEVEVTAVVNAVEEKEDLTLDDDFAGLVGDYETLDELKESIREDIARNKQYQVDQDLIPQVLEKVVAAAETIKWPAALEEQELAGARRQREQELARDGLDLPGFLAGQQKTEAEFDAELLERVRENIRTSLVLSKIVELEDLQIDNEALRQQAEWMTMLSGGTREAARAFQSQSGLQMLASSMLTEQARRRLLAIAKGEVDFDAADAEAEDAAEVETVIEAVAENDAPVAAETANETGDTPAVEAVITAEAETEAESADEMHTATETDSEKE